MTRQHKPLVAVLDAWTSVVHALEDAGAEVVQTDTWNEVGRATRFVDAIVLTGGGDVNPKRYGADKHHSVSGIDNSRDQREIEAVNLARRRGCLVMGICRGHQILNIAHGGTLIQNIPDSWHTDTHGYSDHVVLLRRKSKLATALRTTTLAAVTSLHHQAIDRLGDGLVPVGWATDGIVEAVEAAPGEKPYVLGVQFHPEMEYMRDEDARAIFRHFVTMARRRSVSRGRYATRLRDFRRLVDETEQHTRWWGGYKVTPIKKYYEDSGHDWDYDPHWGENSYNPYAPKRWEDETEKRCAFPPCRDPRSCWIYNDCAAEAMARIKDRKSDFEVALKEKRGRKKSRESKGYRNRGGGMR